jgi:hypothetical protein
VSDSLLSDAQLDALRTVGDVALGDVNKNGRRPALERPDDRYIADVAKVGVVEALKNDAENHAQVRGHGKAALARWREIAPDRFGVNTIDLAEQVQEGRRLFEAHGEEIAAALLLAGLPELYATQWGAPVLVAHGEFVWHVQRRVRQTAQFLIDVLSREQPDENGDESIERLMQSALAVRYFHHQLRLYFESDPTGLGERNTAPNWPLNQEDLLGTLLTFTVTVFRVFSAFGIKLSADEQRAYLLLWDLVGELMGIGDEAAVKAAAEAAGEALGSKTAPFPSTLRPSSVPDAKRLLDRMHARQWLRITGILDQKNQQDWVLPSDPLNPGRILTRALLDGLSEAMPPLRRQLPLNAMRALALGEVRSRLGLTGGGLMDYAWGRLPARRWHADPWTTSTTPNRVGATMLRLAATDVSRHAILAFLKAEGPPFVFPNLDFGVLGPPPPNPAPGPSFLEFINHG